MSDHATTMYALPPILTLPTICPRSKTMYEMRSIHEDGYDGHHDADTDAKMPDNVITKQELSPEYSALEIRQEKILNQLAELKKQVSTLCSFLKRSNKIAIKRTGAPINTKKIININLLIKANPLRKPYLLYALQKLWKDTDIRIETYKHSTIKQEIPDCFPANMICTTKNVVNITMIWKKVQFLETFTDLQSEPLIGEVNLLRYLYRMIDTYENDCTQTHLMDNVLDMCYAAFCQENASIRKILYALNNTLDEWSGKDNPNIADIAMWSMLKGLGLPLPENLVDFVEKYDDMFIDESIRYFFPSTCTT